MIKRLAFMIFSLGILYLVGYRLWYGYFPPETPHKIIGRYLKEPIPSDWNIVYFHHSEGAWVATPSLMAIVDVPSQNIELAKDLIYNTKPFSSAANLREDTCFAKSEFARYSMFSDFLTRNSSGFFECYIKEKSIKSDEDSVSTYVAVSKTVVLDVENKRLMLGMF